MDLLVNALTCCYFSLRLRRTPRSTLFPYTTLFRSLGLLFAAFTSSVAGSKNQQLFRKNVPEPVRRLEFQDRKSTRLNSSHLGISYAVFCLKKTNVIVFFAPIVSALVIIAESSEVRL